VFDLTGKVALVTGAACWLLTVTVIYGGQDAPIRSQEGLVLELEILRERHQDVSDLTDLAVIVADVLLEGALEPHPDVREDRRSEHLAIRAWVLRRRRPDPAEHRPGDDVLADPVSQGDGDVGLGGQLEEQFGVDGLDVSGVATD